MPYFIPFLLLLLPSIVVGQKENIHTDRTTHFNKRANRVDSESSITQTAISYKLTARLAANKREPAMELLIKTLGETYQSDGVTGIIWREERRGATLLFCRFDAGELSLTLDKTMAPDELLEQVEDLGERVKALVGEHGFPIARDYFSYGAQGNSRKVKERQLELALKELERAQKKVEKARKALKQ
ncbi:MAG: hypothetical protein AAGF89_03735 [Bacteroidota bacterium]